MNNRFSYVMLLTRRLDALYIKRELQLINKLTFCVAISKLPIDFLCIGIFETVTFMLLLVCMSVKKLNNMNRNFEGWVPKSMDRLAFF